MSEVSLQTVTIKKGYCVRFFYYMYGEDIGFLTVSAQSVSQATDTKRFFYRTRTQGDRWKEAFFTVTESDTMKIKGYREREGININSTVYTPELGSHRVLCQLYGFTWKVVHTVIPKGDISDLTSVLAAFKSVQRLIAIENRAFLG
ncbi:hypothetical protein AVEN_148867-1 [Araneus ventricosus]|uniref:MAM domain-containing protein n=1 Tax=Araneus ventricosus TaxID=182803 RepID=A0A4Y2BEG7_ARAVE|nr:hypothetical protein AVEN_136205-1 [Araneus ventricosus]GBL90152.1 hypothetical protein AVEN_148867-1 [Araneus ventricosus]